MDYKSVEIEGNAVVIRDVRNFELSHIFECGQCFRWNKQPSGSYIGIAYGKVIEVEKKGEDVLIYNSSVQEVESIWIDYFDLSRDYSEIKSELSHDPLLKKAVAFGSGIRLLRQEPFELVISFIVSANNRIPMIKRAIDNISSKWGTPIEYNGKTYHSFPMPDKLNMASEEELEGCSTGFRAKYIKDTVAKIAASKNFDNTSEYDLKHIKDLGDDECHMELQKFSGIGPKVADCIMLFSMQKYSAFPVDVWVKRAMAYFYLAPDVSLKKIREFGRNKFGILSGFAQQYLFYYARENNIKVD